MFIFMLYYISHNATRASIKYATSFIYIAKYKSENCANKEFQ